MTSRVEAGRRVAPVLVADEASTAADRWLSGYPNPETRRLYANRLRTLLRHTGIAQAEHASEAQVISWATAGGSNNNIRGRISVALSFYGWCDDNGVECCDTKRLRNLKRQYPKVYGRAQAPNPARWLTHEEAFERLIPACQDGTLVGLRDELVIRFGLSGMRKAEIVRLTWRNLANRPSVEWTGKGNRPRRIVLGSIFLAVLDRWQDEYPDPSPESPVVCRTAGTVSPRVDWGHGYRPQTKLELPGFRGHGVVTDQAARLAA